MTKHNDDTVTLLLVIGGILLIILMIGIPLIKGQVAKRNPQVSIIAPKGCSEGTACESCVEQAGKQTCFPGICDARGNCLVQAQAPPPDAQQERGLRALVYS